MPWKRKKECGRKVKEGWAKRSLRLSYKRLVRSSKLDQVSFISFILVNLGDLKPTTSYFYAIQVYVGNAEGG